MTSRPSDAASLDAVQTGRDGLEPHETRYSSRLSRCYRALRLRAIHFSTRSTIKGDMLSVEICSSCHPFFTGKQKLIDTAGRVERFTKKYADAAAKAEAAKK